MMAEPDRGSTQRLHFGSSMGRIIRLYFGDLWRLVGLMAALQLPYLAISLLASLLSSGSAGRAQGVTELVSVHLRGVGSSGWVLLLYLLVVGPLTSGAITWAVWRRYQGTPWTVRESYRVAVQNWVRLLLLSLAYLGLMIVAVIGLAVVNVLFAVIFALFMGRYGSLVLIVVLPASVILTLCIILRLVFSTQAVVLEGLTPLTALDRSWRVSKGSLLPIFSVMAVLTVATLVVEALVGGAGALVAALIGGSGGHGTAAPIVALAAGELAGLVLAPLSWVAVTVMFLELKGAAGTIPPPTPPPPYPPTPSSPGPGPSLPF